MDYVVLVDELDNEVGIMEKMEAHEKAVLHRAFSVFLFNKKGEMLLQRRAFTKYHSGGLWTNACCSHPRPGESNLDAARRRTFEELGFHPELRDAFSFTYRAEFDNGLTEHEFDHVFVGNYEGPIVPDPSEVSEVCYKSMEQIRSELREQPHLYTEWFKIAFHEVEEHSSLL
ncbi:MAG TPA: isopentenyl-diphosphate Delta-isomerase [Flavitalea sp.]|nr:isopentenyl-diphosphate Delta-isomerase [Flavitalea sp.]